MTTRITGNTYFHRDYLKSIGARWDKDRQLWTHFRLSDSERAELVRRGMILSGGRVPPMPGLTPQPPPPPAAPDVWATDDDDAPAPAVVRRLPRIERLPPSAETIEHGNDMSFKDRFRGKPIAYWGFNTLADHIDFVKRIPNEIADDPRDDRNGGWNGDPFFTGTVSMQHALKLAANGWQDGVDKANQIAEALAAQHAKQRKRKHTLAGGAVNVGRMLAGNPAHMISRPKRDGRAVKTIFINGSDNCDVKAGNMIVRAAIIAALCDMMENSGYSCEIVVACNSRSGGRAAWQTATRVKAAGEKINLSDIVFSLGHPSFLRRIVFATVATEERCRDVWADGYGYTIDLFNRDKPLETNEYEINRLGDGQALIKGNTLIERALSMFPLIVPENFPIQPDTDK